MKLTLVWDEDAFQQFEEAIFFIEADSLKSAEKFSVLIIKKLNELLLQPERYPLDKYKTKNDGSFCAFEVFKYRLAYQYKTHQIRIIRLRHTKRSPLSY